MYAYIYIYIHWRWVFLGWWKQWLLDLRPTSMPRKWQLCTKKLMRCTTTNHPLCLRHFWLKLRFSSFFVRVLAVLYAAGMGQSGGSTRADSDSILYSTTLHYTIIFYTILYHTILHYTIPYHTIPYYTILYYTILYYNEGAQFPGSWGKCPRTSRPARILTAWSFSEFLLCELGVTLLMIPVSLIILVEMGWTKEAWPALIWEFRQIFTRANLCDCFFTWLKRVTIILARSELSYLHYN